MDHPLLMVYYPRRFPTPPGVRASRLRGTSGRTVRADRPRGRFAWNRSRGPSAWSVRAGGLPCGRFARTDGANHPLNSFNHSNNMTTRTFQMKTDLRDLGSTCWPAMGIRTTRPAFSQTMSSVSLRLGMIMRVRVPVPIKRPCNVQNY